MKRRGFLGFAAGAAVSGPAYARAAASQMVLSSGSGSILGTGMNYVGGKEGIDVGGYAEDDWAQRQLVNLLGKTAAEIAREKRRLTVHVLDGDIAGMRSLAWHAKIAMQQDRDYERSRNDEIFNLREYIGKMVTGQ